MAAIFCWLALGSHLQKLESTPYSHFFYITQVNYETGRRTNSSSFKGHSCFNARGFRSELWRLAKRLF